MELCTTQAAASTTLANLPNNNKLFASRYLRSKLALPLRKTQISRSLSSGIKFSTKIRATASEETSSGQNEYVAEKRDGPITLEDVPSVEKNAYNENVSRVSPQEVEDVSSVNASAESPQEEPSMDGLPFSLEFLNNLNIKFESEEDIYSLLLYGGGALVALWLASAVVGAIDSIPLFPKLMEIVGLGYTVWFSWRYLIFKRNREELFAKVDQLKQEVLGSKED